MQTLETNNKMEYPLMVCGHTAQAEMEVTNEETKQKVKIPVCAICVGIHPGATTIVKQKPSIIDRKARCTYFNSCHNEVMSDYKLAFFEYKGTGSFYATNKCKCGRDILAHKQGTIEHSFAPNGPALFDSYYCGCQGWE